MATLVGRITDLTLAIRNKFNAMNDKFSTDAITIMIDGGGSLIKTGVRLDVQIPFACVLKSWTLLADQAGSLQVDLWKSTYANYPPTLAGSITASLKPILATALKSTGVVPSGWIATCEAGDILRVNVDSILLVQRATLTLHVKRL